MQKIYQLGAGRSCLKVFINTFQEHLFYFGFDIRPPIIHIYAQLLL